VKYLEHLTNIYFGLSPVC